MSSSGPAVPLDELDLKILAALQRDAGRSNAEIAAQVGLSPSPCWRRVQRLEQAGVVQRRVAILDAEKLGLGVVVFASVKLSAHGRQAIPEFEESIRGYPEVVECYTVTGEVDFILRIVTRDTRSYERFLRDSLLQLPHIHEVHSTIALTQVKYTTEVPLALAARE
jgi:Lrp/AsnC family transcriptional regulator, cysteine-sensing transcriptional activator